MNVYTFTNQGLMAGASLAALEEFPEVEIVPTTFWSFSAGPTIESKAYEKMKQDILDCLAAGRCLWMRSLPR